MALCLQPGLVPYVALAEAAQGLRDRSTEPGSGSSRWVETRSGPVLVVERRTSTGRAAYLAGEAALRTEWLGLVRPALSSLGLEIALATPDGRAVAGTPPPSGHTVRLAQSTHLPWTVMVFPNQSKPSVPDFRGALLFGGLAVLLLGVGGAMWVANRAVARELELARLKSEFVATVSHEFRTPLTAIRQLSELLVTGRVALQEDRQEYYKLLAAQGERLHRLVEGLLNFGRLEAGRLRLRKERFDAAEFARREAAQFEQQPAAGGFRIECSLPPEPALVEADPDALRLSLANLLENAVKYSPGMASVAVNVSAGGDRVRIAVGDRGPGIEPGEQKRIFEKFVRGQAAQAGNVPGTGIGLAMARELMLAHGGDIELHSEVGKGSTFTLVLPRVN
jgi:signal transduction histidine kinase